MTEQPTAALGAFNAVIDRIESVVASETEALTQRMPIDIGAINAARTRTTISGINKNIMAMTESIKPRHIRMGSESDA